VSYQDSAVLTVHRIASAQCFAKQNIAPLFKHVYFATVDPVSYCTIVTVFVLTETSSFVMLCCLL